jgi:predicted secreted hydrolase
VARWWRRHGWPSSARASAMSVASWDALDSEMYSGAGLTLATVGGVVVKVIAEARDGASLVIESA